MNNKELVKKHGFHRYYPIRYFSHKFAAEAAQDFLAARRKTLKTGTAVVYEGQGIYSLCARTRAKFEMGRKVLPKR